MFTEKEIPWLTVGYRIFAYQGPVFLKVENLSREVGVSKSSFYHLFADMDVFLESLLMLHRQRAHLLATRSAQCSRIDPDFIELLVEHKEDIFFNRRLRIHHETVYFQLCYQSGHMLVENAILPAWINWLGMQTEPELARSVFNVSSELFYQRLQINEYSKDWIKNFLDEWRVFLSGVMKKQPFRVLQERP